MIHALADVIGFGLVAFVATVVGLIVNEWDMCRRERRKRRR